VLSCQLMMQVAAASVVAALVLEKEQARQT
jgi:hypothetical protein